MDKWQNRSETPTVTSRRLENYQYNPVWGLPRGPERDPLVTSAYSRTCMLPAAGYVTLEELSQMTDESQPAWG